MTSERSAIVSGGTYGIGRAITLELARRHWRVLAFGLETRQPGSAAENGIAGTRAALEREGLDADLLEADTADPEQVRDAVEQAAARAPLAAVVCNAAIRPVGTLLETGLDVFDRVMATNLRGPWLLAREALPRLRATRGAIVLLGSGAARGKPGLAAYAVSKGGVLALGRALAIDHRQDGVRVNVVIPAPRTPSGMIEEMGASPRAGAQDAVARKIGFLVSDDAWDVTGEVVELGEASDAQHE